MNIKKKDLLNSHHGRFYKADWIPTKEPPIVLMILKNATAEREVSWYLTFNSHPYIVHTFGLVGNNDQLPMLLQEYAPHGNLQTLLQSGRLKPSSNILIEIFLQICDAMIYITKQGAIHGDLCCSNVLVFKMSPLNPSENLIKLTHFSTTCIKDSPYIDNRQTGISMRYCAPEF